MSEKSSLTRRAAITLAALSSAVLLTTSPGLGSKKKVVEPSAQEWIAAMAQEHEGDTPVPSGAALEPRQPVTGKAVQYADGVTGYMAQPQAADGPLPALIVIHEWWGLNDNIRAMTDRLAGEGYRALAVDLYGGKVAASRDDAMGLMGAAMEDIPAASTNLRNAHAFLAESHDAPAIGVIGWCFGGGWALAAAITLGDELDAAVIYYGRLVTDEERLAQIEAPVLGLFGQQDEGIPVASVKAFTKAMKEVDKKVEVTIYPKADHAFANPSGTRYNAEAAEDAWKKTTAFLEETLKKGSSG